MRANQKLGGINRHFNRLPLIMEKSLNFAMMGQIGSLGNFLHIGVTSTFMHENFKLLAEKMSADFEKLGFSSFNGQK